MIRFSGSDIARGLRVQPPPGATSSRSRGRASPRADPDRRSAARAVPPRSRPRRYAAGDQPRRRDEQPGARHLGEAAVPRVAQATRQRHQLDRRGPIDAALVGDDRRFELRRRQANSSATNRCRVLGLRSLSPADSRDCRRRRSGSRRRFEQLAGLVDREHPPVIGQRMDDDDGVRRASTISSR